MTLRRSGLQRERRASEPVLPAFSPCRPRTGTTISSISLRQSPSYLLDNSKAWFARACGTPESRSWLEDAIEHDANVYLVVGYHTLVDARVTEQARISESRDLSTGVKLTGGGVPGVGGVELVAELGAVG